MATSTIKRTYTNFKGVDFANEPSVVDITRSPDALNIWKNYSDTQGSCIETRPGYVQIGNFENNINGMYFYNNKTFVHAGTNLYLWNGFPGNPEDKTLLKNDMNNKKSSFAIFDDKLYILDGKNYLTYYNNELKNVSEDNPTIPTTTIARSPSGGGELYEDVNVLQPLRKNTFLADGKSTDFYLDSQNIEEVVEVRVNNATTTEYTTNKIEGKIKFNTAPEEPNLAGIDNVEVTFKKSVTGYIDRIDKCTKIVSFDRRLFFTGNPDYPNAIFHSKINEPSYVSDLAYYQDGSDESKIKAMVVGNNILWVFKEPNQQNETIFYHTASLEEEGKVYPSYQGNVSTGCYADATNYKDDIVFLSRHGLEGISSNDINSKQLLSHRSSLVDNKLINENNFNNAMMTEYMGYLLILANYKIYLADMRQIFQGALGYEYEWYLWDLQKDKISYLKEYKGNLYIGSENGLIFHFQGTNDNGIAINSYWTTPMDNFGYSNLNKTTNKRGGLAKIKTIPNGEVKIAEKTNKKEELKEIAKYSATGFDFNNIDFNNFSFETRNNSYIVYKIKEKKFVEISLKFYSDELDKPFGIYSAILEAFVGGYVKK
ncbi:MAG: hypothetical protein HFJ48_00075 [Clostridia bacterium]|nr:hypothetical protein [Clostridia bacterium]